MLEAIKYHFRHLTDFSGRDARQTFWYWFLFLFIAQHRGVDGRDGADDDRSDVDGLRGRAQRRSGSGRAADDGTDGGIDAHDRCWWRSSLGIVNLLLIAAAFVRRLHDSGKSGLVGGACRALIYLGIAGYGWLDARRR